MVTEVDSPVIWPASATLVAPIASDLGLDLYDVEQRGGTLRVTLDTPAGSAGGVTLDDLALASRLVSRELDHDDPIPGRYTLEVTSPGVERALRTPAHFQPRDRQGRRHPPAPTSATTTGGSPERSSPPTTRRPPSRSTGPTARRTAALAYDQIDRAKTVFELGSRPPEARAGEARSEEGALVVTNLDMTEAIRLLAQEKGLSEDSLLHVLVDALASAYKRRPGAADEVVVEVDPQTMEFTFIAYDLDEDGNWINERDDTPRRDELGRIAAQTFRQVMSQRIREVERDRKFEEYANREGDIVTGHHPADRHPLHAARPRSRRGAAAAGRAGALRAPAARRSVQGLHRRGPRARPRARRSSSAAPIPG